MFIFIISIKNQINKKMASIVSSQQDFSKNDNYIDFTGCSKEEVIEALWNGTKHLGFGNLHNTQTKLSEDEIKCAISINSIDYLKGKPLKINLKHFPFIQNATYDRDSIMSMKDIAYNLKNNRKLTFTKEPLKKKGDLIKEFQLDKDIIDISKTTSISVKKHSLRWWEKEKNIEIKKWTKVYLTDKYVTEAKNNGIPYPSEFFIIVGIENNSNTYDLMGSMGGRISNISCDEGNVIKKIK